MFKLKQVLDDIVGTAYKGSPNLAAYKRYYVEYLDRKLKSKVGDYNPRNHHIRVFVTGRTDGQIIRASIHELAHHIDYMKNGETGHKSPFYDAYTKLLYAAIDMGIFSVEDFRNDPHDTQDWNKVSAILDAYVPRQSEYKKGYKQIVVHNAFDIKEKLKENGYRYNAISKNWEKEYPAEDDEKEKRFIMSLTDDFESAAASAVTFQKSKANY